MSISYQAEESESLLQPAILSIILAIVIGVVSMLVVSLRRKRQAAIDELAGVFSYTAELLAAGDEVREAIFNCYEGLCSILMGRGFLREILRLSENSRWQLEALCRLASSPFSHWIEFSRRPDTPVIF